MVLTIFSVGCSNVITDMSDVASVSSNNTSKVVITSSSISTSSVTATSSSNSSKDNQIVYKTLNIPMIDDEKFEELVAILQEMTNLIFTKENLIVSFTGENIGYNNIEGGITNPMNYENIKKYHINKMRSIEVRNKISNTMKKLRQERGFSQETRNKISEKLKGNQHFKGKKRSLEAIEKTKVLLNEVQKAEYLRSKAIGKLVDQVTLAFQEHHDELLNGTLEKSLIDCTESAEPLNEIYKRSAEVIYTTPRVTEVVIAGFELFSGMLDIFVASCNDIAENGESASPRSKRMIHLLPDMKRYVDTPDWRQRSYVRIITVLDYLSGMSDSYALSLYKKLKGISL